MMIGMGIKDYEVIQIILLMKIHDNTHNDEVVEDKVN